jgi:hypothetical protein
MNNSIKIKALILTAAVGGFLGGTTTRLQAQPLSQPISQANPNAAASSNAGVPAHWSQTADDTTKHSCKGKNDCKGQGGCKSSDNGCKGKNSCKGKGGCATDGSKMPK